MTKLLTGFGYPPFLVGFLRAFLEAVAIGALGSAVVWLTSYDWTVLGVSPEISALIILPAIMKGARVIEAALDQINPLKTSANDYDVLTTEKHSPIP